MVARLMKREEILKGGIVTSETKMTQRTGDDFEGPELQREFKTEFRFDDCGRLYSKQQGGVPGRADTLDVLQRIEVGAFDGQGVTILRGKDNFDWAYRGPDQSRIPREIDPREFLLRSGNESLVLLLGRMKYRIAGKERWRDQDVIVLESEPIVKADAKISYQGRMLVAPSLDDAVVVRSHRIRYDDVGLIEAISSKFILFTDVRAISTDEATKYARVADNGEEQVARNELRPGIRVRYEFAPGQGATKVVILSD